MGLEVPKVNHTTIRNENLFCKNCGGKFPLKFPVPIDIMTKKIDAFNALHSDCQKTWIEKIPNTDIPTHERANLWIAQGEHGLSSKAMWCCFIGVKGGTHHPHDPDDFSRCYKLLQYVPEWKNQLHKLKRLSPIWIKLVDNWEKLTNMYEENEKTNWRNSNEIGMYEFMKSLIR